MSRSQQTDRHLPIKHVKNTLAPYLALERLSLQLLSKSRAYLSQSGLANQDGHSHQEGRTDQAHGQPEETS